MKYPLLGAVHYPQVRNEIVGITANWNDTDGRTRRVNGGRGWHWQEALAQQWATRAGKIRGAVCFHGAGSVSLRRYMRFQRYCLFFSN